MSDGGSPIVGYVIEARTAYNPRWMKVTRTPVKGTEFVYTDPLEGDEYEFRVVAVNEAGYSRPSNATPLTRIKDPFGLWFHLSRIFPIHVSRFVIAPNVHENHLQLINHLMLTVSI